MSLVLQSAQEAMTLQAITSEIYGDSDLHPQPEDYWSYVNPIGQRSCSDEGKRAAETIFSCAHRQDELRIKVARTLNTCIPQMPRSDGVSPTSSRRPKEMSPLGSFDGLQTRAFCYVDTLMEGVIEFMDSPNEVREPLTLGTLKELTMSQLTEQIVALAGSNSLLGHQSLPTGDPRQRSMPESISSSTRDVSQKAVVHLESQADPQPDVLKLHSAHGASASMVRDPTLAPRRGMCRPQSLVRPVAAFQNRTIGSESVLQIALPPLVGQYSSRLGDACLPC